MSFTSGAATKTVGLLSDAPHPASIEKKWQGLLVGHVFGYAIC